MVTPSRSKVDRPRRDSYVAVTTLRGSQNTEGSGDGKRRNKIQEIIKLDTLCRSAGCCRPDFVLFVFSVEDATLQSANANGKPGRKDRTKLTDNVANRLRAPVRVVVVVVATILEGRRNKTLALFWEHD